MKKFIIVSIFSFLFLHAHAYASVRLPSPTPMKNSASSASNNSLEKPSDCQKSASCPDGCKCSKHACTKSCPATNKHNEQNLAQATEKHEKAFKLIPHQATYDIVFDREKQKELDSDGIRDIQGTMTIKLVDAVDGWIFEQHTIVFIYYDNDQPAEQIRTTIVTWESKDGERYDFKVRTVRNDQEDNVSGKAFAPKNLIGFVEIEKPEPVRFDLPKGTMFPLAYLSSIIKTALKGDLVAPIRPIFDVSNESLEPVDSMASISMAFDPGIKTKNPNIFKGADQAWEVRYTIFPLGCEESSEDNFEMKQTVLSNGVIAGMTMDLGKTNTRLVLKKVELFSDYGNPTNPLEDNLPQPAEKEKAPKTPHNG